MIIWFTGQPGSGKTTLADMLQQHIDLAHPPLWQETSTVRIDGDDLRDLVGNPGYDEKGRRQNIDRAMAIARFMEARGFLPIVSLISPYRDQREQLKEKTTVLEIHTFCSKIRGRERFFAEGYQRPLTDFTFIDTSHDTEEQSLKKILAVYRQVAAVSRGAQVAD